jgi:hypothetical protein
LLLITELNNEAEYLTETTESGEKHHYIQGIFLQSELKNRNGRVYPLSILEAEVNRYMTERVQRGTAYGELGHPKGPQINLERVSHLVTELKRDGNDFIGKARIAETPMGDIALGLMKTGANLGVSSRGMGTLKPLDSGIMEVQSDFRLATAADIVADPSAPNAFVRGIMEGVEWFFDPFEGTWREEVVHDTRSAMRQMTVAQIEEQKLALFESFIKSLVSKSR